MDTTSYRVTAGLLFLNGRDFDMAALVCRVGETLERLGTRVTERRCLSDELAVIRTGDFDCRLQHDGPCDLARLARPAETRLMLTLLREGGLPSADHRRMQAVIAHLLADLQGVLAPDYVQWTDPDAVLTRDEFRAAVVGTAALPVPERVAPKVRRRKRLPDVESVYAGLRETIPGQARSSDEGDRLAALRAAFRDPDPEAGDVADDMPLREPTAPLRLAVWLMTITQGLFALPVAAALAVVNLLRGENLRLTSQMSALTGLFMVLASTGQIAQAADLMQALLP